MRFLKKINIIDRSKEIGPQEMEWVHMIIYKKDQPNAFWVHA
jgi:hypothetical protein